MFFHQSTRTVTVALMLSAAIFNLSDVSSQAASRGGGAAGGGNTGGSSASGSAGGNGGSRGGGGDGVSMDLAAIAPGDTVRPPRRSVPRLVGVVVPTDHGHCAYGRPRFEEDDDSILIQRCIVNPQD